MLPSTPQPSLGETTNIPGLQGQMGASPTTPMAPLGGGGGLLAGLFGGGTGGGAPGLGANPLAATGSNFWQSPFGRYLQARHGIGPGPGPMGMNPILTAALGRMVQPAYSAAGTGNPFTFNPSGPQFQA
jgi:hypothetical protein